MAKKNAIVRALEKRIKSNGLFLALGLISIIGFALNTVTVFTGKPITNTFAYPSIILGIGLIFESNIRSVLQMKKRTPASIPKLITAVVGLVVLFGGLATLPFLNIAVEGAIAGAIGLANLLAIVVIIYEVFIIE